MQFDWRAQRVRVEGAIFADVECVQAPPLPKPRPKPAVPKRPGGRPAFPMEEMVDIARSRLGTRLPNNQKEAEALLADFSRLHRPARPPGIRTVKDHLAAIYGAAAEDAVPLNPRK
jgi:hypothetical protein